MFWYNQLVKLNNFVKIFKIMVRVFFFFAAIIFLTGSCRDPVKESYRIATLKGPSSMGMIYLIDSLAGNENFKTHVDILDEPIQVRKMMLEGTADFATLWLSTGIQLRAQGVKVVNIAQILRRSALMLVAKKSSGILRPEDVAGKKVGLWGAVFQIQPRAFFRKYNLDVQVVPQSYSVNLFLRDGVDVASAMWYNEYHTILNCGLDPEELTTFFFHEHGLNFPEDGIYVLEETLQKNPQLCRAFVTASIEGWLYAFDHPDETIAIVMRNLEEAHIPATAVHQKWMLERMKDLMLPDDGEERSVGMLLPEEYHRVAMGLKSGGLIDTVPGFTSFYRGCFE